MRRRLNSGRNVLISSCPNCIPSRFELSFSIMQFERIIPAISTATMRRNDTLQSRAPEPSDLFHEDLCTELHNELFDACGTVAESKRR